MDYMCEHDCEWLVSKGCIIIGGQSLPLLKCPHKANERCVMVRESVIVPADYAVTVLMKKPFSHHRMPGNDWLSEAKEIQSGWLAARTLLPHRSEFAAVAILNVCGKDQRLRHNMQIGMVTACLPDSIRPLESSDMTAATNRHDGTDMTGRFVRLNGIQVCRSLSDSIQSATNIDMGKYKWIDKTLTDSSASIRSLATDMASISTDSVSMGNSNRLGPTNGPCYCKVCSHRWLGDQRKGRMVHF